jgi:hypothetical protein
MKSGFDTSHEERPFLGGLVSLIESLRLPRFLFARRIVVRDHVTIHFTPLYATFETRVRFPSPAPIFWLNELRRIPLKSNNNSNNNSHFVRVVRRCASDEISNSPFRTSASAAR